MKLAASYANQSRFAFLMDPDEEGPFVEYLKMTRPEEPAPVMKPYLKGTKRWAIITISPEEVSLLKLKFLKSED